MSATHRQSGSNPLAPSTSYTYRGDRWTDPALKGQRCVAIRRADGKCIRGTNGSMLVAFAGRPTVVLGRQLRKVA